MGSLLFEDRFTFQENVEKIYVNDFMCSSFTIMSICNNEPIVFVSPPI